MLIDGQSSRFAAPLAVVSVPNTNRLYSWLWSLADIVLPAIALGIIYNNLATYPTQVSSWAVALGVGISVVNAAARLSILAFHKDTSVWVLLQLPAIFMKGCIAMFLLQLLYGAEYIDLKCITGVALCSVGIFFPQIWW